MGSRPHWVAHCRPPRGPSAPIARVTDAERLASFATDAAHVPGGHTPAVCFPASEAAVAAVLAGAERVLPIGSQSSLTGGATPRGEVVLSTQHLATIGAATSDQIVVEPGVVLATLAEALAARGQWYPPIPTYDGATVGGTVATNAAGAGHLQIRRDPRLGPRARPSCSPTAACSRSDAARSRRAQRATSRSSASTADGAASTSRPTACRRSGSSPPATTPPRAWTSSTSSSAPKARSAS